MNRRIFLKATVLSVIPVSSCANSNGELPLTGKDAQGPFYPVEAIPLDSSLIVGENFLGDELEFSGTVLNTQALPQPATKIEIWQCDAKSIYNHPGLSNVNSRDPAFRGFGAMRCDDEGRFGFRTIVPVAYPGRPPHIHVKLWRGESELLTTQVYLQDNRSPASRIILPQVSGQERVDYAAAVDFIV